MKKKLSVLFAALLLLLAMPMLGGCAVAPWEVDWVLDHYIKDDVAYSTSFDDMDYFATLPIELVTIRFTEEGDFTFTDYSGALFAGTFTYESNLSRTTVKLMFEGGETAEGWCIMSYFDGTWYDAYFEIGGVEYYFEDRRGNSDPFADGLAREATRLMRFEENGKNYYDGLYRGEAKCEDGVWFLTIYDNNGEYFRFNLSRAGEDGASHYPYTVYEYDGNYVISETALREGACAVKYNAYSERFAIHFRAEEQAEEVVE